MWNMKYLNQFNVLSVENKSTWVIWHVARSVDDLIQRFSLNVFQQI